MMQIVYISMALAMSILPWSAFAESTHRIDPTFANNGVSKISFGLGKSWVSSGVTQPDGKIIVAGSVYYKGYSEAIALTRTHSNGLPDNSFGEKGVVVTKVGVNSRSTAIAVLPDERIVVVGWAYLDEEKNGIALAMFNADGTLDLQFGRRGVLIFPTQYSTAYARTVSVQSDGKIVVGGKITVWKKFFNLSVPEDHIFLARLNKNGTFDTSFGTDGVTTTSVHDSDTKESSGLEITSVVLQQDGKILVAGVSSQNRKSILLLARYYANGSIDKRFGLEGFINKTIADAWYVRPTLSSFSDDCVYLMGGYNKQGNNLFFLTKLSDKDRGSELCKNNDLTITTSFKLNDGFIPILQADGKVLVLGMSVRQPQPNQPPIPTYYDIGVSRFLSNGNVDKSFGGNGVQVISIGLTTDKPAYMTVQSNGRIVISGHVDDGTEQHVVLVGLMP